MGIVKIEKVKTTILTLKEGIGGERNIVSVTLAKGAPVSGTEYFLGIMTYWGKKKRKGKRVDMVSAYFPSTGNIAGMEGNVELRINLLDGHTFRQPYVTTVPQDKMQTPLHCVNVESTNDLTSLIVKFIGPKKGESIAYPALYFHTSGGVLDPGIGVVRRPPK